MSPWQQFGIVLVCFGALFIWHIVVTRREMNALPSGSLDARFAWRGMLGQLDRPVQKAYNRMVLRAFLICLAMFPIVLLLSWVNTLLRPE